MTITEIEIASVAWEPCTGFLEDTDAGDGRCAGCGWTAEEHEEELPTAA